MTLVVAIPVHFLDARKVCEFIENTEFLDFNELQNVIRTELNVVDDDEKNVVKYFNLTDFMDSSNNQEFDHDGHFISYVRLKEAETNSFINKARDILSLEDDSDKNILKVIESIHAYSDQEVTIDNVLSDGVYVIEMFEYVFTCSNFLSFIGYNK